MPLKSFASYKQTNAEANRKLRVSDGDGDGEVIKSTNQLVNQESSADLIYC